MGRYAMCQREGDFGRSGQSNSVVTKEPLVARRDGEHGPVGAYPHQDVGSQRDNSAHKAVLGNSRVHRPACLSVFLQPQPQIQDSREQGKLECDEWAGASKAGKAARHGLPTPLTRPTLPPAAESSQARSPRSRVHPSHDPVVLAGRDSIPHYGSLAPTHFLCHICTSSLPWSIKW
jgi:hypothetical protein